MKTGKILVIQTAFIGDVILTTSLLEKIHYEHPNYTIDLLLRKGNGSLFTAHPYIENVFVWDKKSNKYLNLFRILKSIRKEKYDKVINLQRFGASGLLTAFSNAQEKIGFNKNPFSFFFDKKIKHTFDQSLHETERNLKLIDHFTNEKYYKPKIYPSLIDFEKVKSYKTQSYITIAPASVWFTKQFPKDKWTELITTVDPKTIIYLLGSFADRTLCEVLKNDSKRANCINLAGELSLLQSAALMKDAEMNYVNDSAPLHLASAMNAPTTAIYCSTVPAFGFGPLADNNRILETKLPLSCRPCGLHGKSACPEGHFNCALNIKVGISENK